MFGGKEKRKKEKLKPTMWDKFSLAWVDASNHRKNQLFIIAQSNLKDVSSSTWDFKTQPVSEPKTQSPRHYCIFCNCTGYHKSTGSSYSGLMKLCAHEWSDLEKQSLKLKGSASLRVTDVYNSSTGLGFEQSPADRSAVGTAPGMTETGRHLLPTLST